MLRKLGGLILSSLLIIACGGADSPLLHGELIQPIRPNEIDRSPMWVFGEDDVIESYDSAGGAFRVHYTRAGKHAVPAQDLNEDGIPDFVEEVADTYDEVKAFFEGLGFRAPLGDEELEGDQGGDGRFDVYLLDFGFSSDGNFVADHCDDAGCVGHVVQENDFAGYRYESSRVANRILASHEYFHAIQGAYGSSFDVILSEGTAVWASELFDPDLDDLEGFVSGYFGQTDRSLDIPPAGPAPRFAYGSSIFFRFLEERFDAGLIGALLEEGGNGAWLAALDSILAREFETSFASAFQDFARWNLYTAEAADPSVAYREGASYPAVGVVSEELPAQIDRPRIYYASIRYYEVEPKGRAAVVAELVGADPSALEGLQLFAVTRKDGVNLGEARAIGPGGVRVEIDAEGADAVVIGVVNGAIAGESRRPTICLGSEEEVAACKASLDPEAPEEPEEPEEPGVPQDPKDPHHPNAGRRSQQGGGCGAAPGAAELGGALTLAALLRRSRS